MKVMMIVWIAALSLALLVAGRSFEQILLSGKVALIGFVLGFIGAKLSDAITAFRNAKTGISTYRR